MTDSIKTFDFNKDPDENIINEAYKLVKFTNPLLREMGPRSYLAINNDKLVLVTGIGSLMYANINEIEKI